MEQRENNYQEENIQGQSAEQEQAPEMYAGEPNVEPEGSVSTPTAKEEFEGRIREKYPHMQEEELYKHAMSKYDKRKKDYNDLAKTVDSLLQVMEENPELEAFFSALIQYPNRPDIAFKQMPKEYLEKAIDEYDDVEEEADLQASVDDYRSKKREKERHNKLVEENQAASDKTVQEVAKELGVKSDEIYSTIETIVKDLADGKLSKETIYLIMKGKSHDSDMRKAEVRGRNAKIEQERMHKKNQTDGLPQPSTSGANLKDTGKQGSDDAFGIGSNRTKWN